MRRGAGGVWVLAGHYLRSVDGTGTFSSSSVHCAKCCEKHRRDGSTEYCHQSLVAVVVHPEHREVFPLAPEPIRKSDGASKNDRERNAARRLIADVRRDHPHLPLIVLEDGLASNGPHIKHSQQHGMRFILGAKRGDLAVLFGELESSPQTREPEVKDPAGVLHEFRYLEGVALNKSHPDLKINVLDYWESKPNGKRQHFAWVSDRPVYADTLMQIMRAGRARGRAEDGTLKTMKNQSCELGHNFGHGHCNLSGIMAGLMMPAFLIDQVEQRCCALFDAAREQAGRLKYLWGGHPRLLPERPHPGVGNPVPVHRLSEPRTRVQIQRLVLNPCTVRARTSSDLQPPTTFSILDKPLRAG